MKINMLYTTQYSFKRASFMRSILVMIMICLMMLSLSASSAWACTPSSPCFAPPNYEPGICQSDGTCKATGDSDGVCTSDPTYTPKTADPGKGIISVVIKDIKDTLKPMTKKMFDGISQDSGFKGAVSAAMTLYVIIYAISFLFGMVQLTAFDFVIRMFKISVVAMLINGTGFQVFSDIVVKFFNEGTDALITQVSTIAVSGTTLGGEPFDWMDNAILELTSVKMLVTLMAAALTGPYGWVIIVILMISLYTFIKAMLGALWVYIMALVLRTLLFGLAPLFLACVMFSRTRQLFDGWLNQVVNSCLQPIFLFTFFAFFVQLIKASLEQVLQTNVCWTRFGSVAGAASAEHYWRFALWNCNSNRWEPFDGVWGFTGADNAPAHMRATKADCGTGSPPVQPLGIMLPLILWILSDLAKRFNEIVVNIAKDIANASTGFSYQGQGFGGDKVTGGGSPGGGAGGATPGAGARPTPGGGVGAPGAPAGGAAGGSTPAPGSVQDMLNRMREAGRRPGVGTGTPPAPPTPPAGGPPAAPPGGIPPKPPK